MNFRSRDHLCEEYAYPDKNEEKGKVQNEVLYLNKGKEDEMEIYGYEKSRFRTILTWISIILSLGSLRLLFHWYPHWMIVSTHKRCCFRRAHKVLVADSYQGVKTYFVEAVIRLSLEKLSLEDLLKTDRNLNVRSASLANTASPIRVYFDDGSYIDETEIWMIQVKKLRYIWKDKRGMFEKIAGFGNGMQKAQLHGANGFSEEEQLLRRLVYGDNAIDVELNSFWDLITEEILNPIYVFQIFSLLLWFAEFYFYYSFAIIAMSVFGIGSSVIQTRQNQSRLRKTLHSTGKVTVSRRRKMDGSQNKNQDVFEEIPTNYLVPGDVLVVPRDGFLVPCDAALLSGNCIVNESMLTGESVPVTKTALPCHKSKFDEQHDVNHILFCGTKVLQARYYADHDVLAVVLRTGYLTSKGGLVRSILYPIPHDFKFDRDIQVFVWVLASVAAVGAVYAAIINYSSGSPLLDLILDTLDIVTIVVPPALPAAMSVGKCYAQNRLKKKAISCINSSVINVSGSINCVCFDKTGTLTEDGLDMYGVVIFDEEKFGVVETNVQNMNYCASRGLKLAMACCHSLTLIDHKISGDPLDAKMFESTGWILDEAVETDSIKFDLLAPSVVKEKEGTEGLEIGIIHQFQFSSHLQRMSVITRRLDFPDEFVVYCKGSPEMIKALSSPETIPGNLDVILEEYTKKGYRVIAASSKSMPPVDVIKLKRLHREDVERNLTFLGLIVFENKLKPQTKPVIEELRRAEMKMVMLTGDNIQTAICVAKECNLVHSSENILHVETEHSSANGCSLPRRLKLRYETSFNRFSRNVEMDAKLFFKKNDNFSLFPNEHCKLALSGDTWTIVREHFPHYVGDIAQNGVIFARMSAEQKQQVIQELQQLGYYVAMCGDGANDVGALRAAHVGISLSEYESSVASPFTSSSADISCVPTICREGRVALVTSFGLFKFMFLYSLTEFFSTALLYICNNKLSDFQFLYIDVFLVVTFAFFFGQTKPHQGPLHPHAPLSSLLSPLPVASLIAQTVLVAFFQSLAFFMAKFFYSAEGSENFAVFAVSQFQYGILATTFSTGKPYRQPIYGNRMFFAALLLMTMISIYDTVVPGTWLARLLELHHPIQKSFSAVILSLAAANLVASLFVESFLVDYVLYKVLYGGQSTKKANNNKDWNKDSNVYGKYYGTMDQV